MSNIHPTAVIEGGLLKIIPQSGTYVASINCRRFEQEWFVRKNLEGNTYDYNVPPPAVG